MSDEQPTQRELLLRKLRGIAERQEAATGHGGTDVEHDHAEADDLLIEYINDPEIEKAYDRIEKWYA